MLIAALGFRWLLSIVLVGSGVAKVGRVASLRNAIVRYQLVPDSLVDTAAKVLPAAELLLGILLATGLLLSSAAIAATCLFVVFAAAVAINLGRGRRFDCGCGLGSAGEVSWFHVGRNVLMASLGVLVAIEPAVLAVGNRFVSGAPAPDQLVAVPLCVVLAGVAVRLPRPLREALPSLRRGTSAHSPMQASTCEP